MPAAGRDGYPVGQAVRLAELAGPGLHQVLARLRAAEPVSWLPVLDGWLVTRYDLAVRVLRDSATFTVDDPRFSTARVVGPSMLSLDGTAHDRHRRPFGGPFSQAEVGGRLAGFVTAEAGRTANEVAARVGARFPGHRADLAAAAQSFDDVRYGGGTGTRDGYERLCALDARLSAAQSAVR